MPSGLPLALPASLQRQLLRAAPRRRLVPTSTQGISSTACLSAPKRPLVAPDSGYTHSSPALSALLSRLSLTVSPEAQTTLQACLTHPSYVASSSTSTSSPSTESEPPSGESNELLSALGNTLLGLYTTEHLASLYPFLPTEALASAVTAYVGNTACLSVARELGVAVTPVISRAEAMREQENDGSKTQVRKKIQGTGGLDQGVPIRWKRQLGAGEALPVARRFKRFVKQAEQGQAEGEMAGDKGERREGWEVVVASCVKAFVGMIYQEQGMHAARQFVHAHFLSRYLDMTSLFNFKNPKHVLARAVGKHLADRGVADSEGQGRIESRVLAETGRHTQSPIFSIGLFLPSGLKLAEGHGSSIGMAEHRAAVNALHSMYLVRSDAGIPLSGTGTTQELPTESHGQWALEAGKVGRGSAWGGEGSGSGRGIGGGAEVVVESSRR